MSKPVSHIERVAAKLPFIQNARKVAAGELKRGEAMVKAAKDKLAKADKDQAAVAAELESLVQEQ